MAKNGGYYYNPALGGLPQPKKASSTKPYKPSAGDLNEKSAGDQEMAMRAEEARVRERNTPKDQSAVRAAIAKMPYTRPPMSAKMSQYTSPITNAPFTGGSTYRKP